MEQTFGIDQNVITLNLYVLF